MLRRLQFWIAVRLMGWPNITMFCYTIVTVFAMWTRDADLFQRAGAIALFSAFWQLFYVVMTLEAKKDVHHGLDLDKTRARYAAEPTFKSDGAKALWTETKKANDDFWDAAEKSRTRLEETIAESGRGALMAGAVGALQLGFGDLLMNSVLQYIEN